MFKCPLQGLFLTLGMWLCSSLQLVGQSEGFWEPAERFHPQRFWISAGTGTGLYAGAMLGLHYAWYAQVERTGFHTFNDWGEWQHIDKYGHILTAYHESRWITQGARWTGLSRPRAIWLGTGTAFVLQGSIELLDAYAAEWGFSWWDMAANTIGCVLFAGQEFGWGEQRILLKLSSAFPRYPETVITSEDGRYQTTLRHRAEDLFGTHPAERFLKDYNAQTYWLSLNPASFMQDRPAWLPAWLNVAMGLRGEHMYAGYGYSWTDADTGARFNVDPEVYPRRMRYFLSLDIDLTRLPVRHPFLRTVCHAFNFIKVPFPALEWRPGGPLQGHWMYF
jgi:hypothetical protein